MSDPDGSVARKFGVLRARGFASRKTFIIDDKGVLRHVTDKVDVRNHGTQLANTIEELKN